MSFIVFDYRCPSCSDQEERFVRRTEMDRQDCEKCKVRMKRLPACPKIDWDALAKGDSASPEAIAHFDRKHKQQAAKEAKAKLDHGDYGKAPGS